MKIKHYKPCYFNIKKEKKNIPLFGLFETNNRPIRSLHFFGPGNPEKKKKNPPSQKGK